MLSLLTGPLRMISKAVLANDSTGQLAGGFTLGMLIGLVPKDSLIAVLLMLLLCSIRVNKSMGLLGALAFSWVGVLTDSFTHQLGMKVLGLESMQASYAWLYDAPLGPWWGFHNTVVIGSLLLGFYIAYPVYWFSYVVCARLRPVFARQFRRYRVNQLASAMNVGAHWGSS